MTHVEARIALDRHDYFLVLQEAVHYGEDMFDACQHCDEPGGREMIRQP